MAVEDNREAVPVGNQYFVNADQVVSFKGHFLDQLLEAVALIEVVEIIIRHHDEAHLHKHGFTGLVMLVEQIKELLDIKDNLLPDGMEVPECHMINKSGAADSS